MKRKDTIQMRSAGAEALRSATMLFDDDEKRKIAEVRSLYDEARAESEDASKDPVFRNEAALLLSTLRDALFSLFSVTCLKHEIRDFEVEDHFSSEQEFLDSLQVLL